MRSILAAICLFAVLASPRADFGANPANPPSETKGPAESLEKIDGQLHRGEWAAAEAESSSLLSDALLRKAAGTFDAVARLALAEAGLGRTEEALWHWSVAQNLKVDFDPKPFGAPGELLASHPLRHLDEVPAGLTIRRAGDGGGPFSPPRIVEAKKVELPSAWGAIPKGIRLQVVVDPQGRGGQPVVVQSTSEGLSYVILKALRDWRFDPARAGGAPVAAFYEIKIPARRPLLEIADLTGSPLAEPEATLRAGRYPEAGKQVGKLWGGASLWGTTPSRGFLGVALALKALAQAGQGEADGAICRWQAAQTLEPRLYGADLSAYGAAGRLLEDHPWGESVSHPKTVPPKAEIQKPEVLERRQPRYPEHARSEGAQGRVVVGMIILPTGVPRNLLLLTPDALPGMEASALEALCYWRFKPAAYQGEPIPVYYTLTVNFEFRN
ncbi:MAG TPA: energy transducer TonB [Thermoanaerobaculia bacterium]|jgi:TonB family protein|nr:energy transducer TonB [Thermoanaerobaculia bacterium]